MKNLTLDIVWRDIFSDHEAVPGVHSPQRSVQYQHHPPAEVVTILNIIISQHPMFGDKPLLTWSRVQCEPMGVPGPSPALHQSAPSSVTAHTWPPPTDTRAIRPSTCDMSC